MSIYDNQIGSMPSDMAEGLVRMVKGKRVNYVLLTSFLHAMECEWSLYSDKTKAAIDDLMIALTMWGNVHLTDEGLEQAIYKFCNERCVVIDSLADVITSFVNSFAMEMDAPGAERKW